MRPSHPVRHFRRRRNPSPAADAAAGITTGNSVPISAALVIYMSVRLCAGVLAAGREDEGAGPRGQAGIVDRRGVRLRRGLPVPE
jgi:hypothetical protein